MRATGFSGPRESRMSETLISEMRCSQCGYDLRGLESRQCPECGEAFDLDDAVTFLTSPISGRSAFAKAVIGLALLVMPPLLAFASEHFNQRPPAIGICIGPVSMIAGFVLCSIATGSAWEVLRARHGWITHRRLAMVAWVIGWLVTGGVLTAVVWRVLSLFLGR